MTTRRIEHPRYGMVVTDGTAPVWMLVAQTYPDAPPGRGDSLVWEAVVLSVPPRRDSIFLDPDAFGEVEPFLPPPSDYLFVGGPADGRRYATGGVPLWVVPTMASLPLALDDESIGPVAPPEPAYVYYELRRDGRYHVTGGR